MTSSVSESPYLSTVVRERVDVLTDLTDKDEDCRGIWNVIHLLNIIGELDAAGHRGIVLEALSRAERVYGIGSAEVSS